MRDPNEYRQFQEIVCHFCDRDIPITSNADLEALNLPEWACWADGCIDDLDVSRHGRGLPSLRRAACWPRLAGHRSRRARIQRRVSGSWLRGAGPWRSPLNLPIRRRRSLPGFEPAGS